MNKIITYSLKLKDKDSDDYYKSISKFTDEVLEEMEVLLGKVVEGFMGYIEKNSIEILRSKNEYLLELLILGVMWQVYCDKAVKTLKVPRKLLIELSELRRVGGSIKSCVDTMRGVLSTGFIAANEEKYNSKAGVTMENLDKLIEFMAAAGEFREEVKRLISWKEYLGGLNSIALEKVFSKVTSISLIFNARSKEALGKYTYMVPNYLKSEYPKHRWKEDIMLCGRQRVEYHLNMVGAEIMNRAFRGDFLSCKEKKLILPACMRIKKEKECRAKKGADGYRCSSCSSSCRVNELTKLGKKCGFEVLIIPHESAAFKDGIKEYGKVGIVGVACILNLISGGYKARRLNFVPQCVILDYCGCKKHWDNEGQITDINLNKLKKIFDKE